MVVEGSHAEHTSHESGEFKHPFLHAPEHVDRIHYVDDKTISLKMKRAKRSGGKYGGPADYHMRKSSRHISVGRKHPRTWL